MRGIVNNKMQQGSVAIVLIGLIAIVVISIAGYRYFEREQSDHTDSLQPTPTIVGLEEDVLSTPEYSEEWKETVIEPRRIYTFRFPDEFEIDNYNPAFSTIKSNDFKIISLEERDYSKNSNFAKFATERSHQWFEEQSSPGSTMVEDVSMITPRLSIMGYYDPGQEGVLHGPRYFLLAYLDTKDYPIRAILAAYCQEFGYHPVYPFREVPLGECRISEYSELRQILVDILSTVQSV